MAGARVRGGVVPFRQARQILRLVCEDHEIGRGREALTPLMKDQLLAYLGAI